MRLFPALLLLLAACSGDDVEPTTPPDPCTGVETSPFPSVAQPDWPAGLDAAILMWKEIDGVYHADRCGDADDFTSIKITSIPEDDLVVETAGLAADANCGCTNDPNFGPDASMDPIAYASDVQAFYDEFLDNAVDNQNIFLEGTFFAPGQPLMFRACHTYDVDPVLDSIYSQVTAIVRVDQAQQLSGTLVLVSDAANDTCELENWDKQPE